MMQPLFLEECKLLPVDYGSVRKLGYVSFRWNTEAQRHRDDIFVTEKEIFSVSPCLCVLNTIKLFFFIHH